MARIMSGRSSPTRAGSRKRGSCRRVKIASPRLSSSPAATPKDDAPLPGTSKYRVLVRQHLDRQLDRLFADFTGLHFHVTWAPQPALKWKIPLLQSGRSVCSRISGSSLHPDCQDCGARQLAHTLSVEGAGHHFTCRLGVRNHWLAIRIRGETVGVACLQALDGNHATPPASKNAGGSVTKILSRTEFIRSARLLRFIIQHVETASLAELRAAELKSASLATLALEKERALARWRQANKGQLTDSLRSLHREERETRPEQIVHRLLERLELDYAKPVSLQYYARELGMNASYLSGLFAHVMGIPFKKLLTSVRLAKAKQLLDDPARNISQIAGTVGYASENRFRAAFKKVTGLCPTQWRETMRTLPASAQR